MAEQYADLAFMHRRVPESAVVDATVPDSAQAALDDSEPVVCVATYGTLAELAHAYYAGHLLAISFPAIMGGEQGPPTALAKGAISASFGSAAAAGSIDDPSTTKYGRMYLQTRALVTGSAARPVG